MRKQRRTRRKQFSSPSFSCTYLLLILPFLFLLFLLPTSQPQAPKLSLPPPDVRLPNPPASPPIEHPVPQPRFARVNLKAERQEGKGPLLHAVLLCETCCDSIAGIAQQTLVPVMMTVLHRCHDLAAMRLSIRTALSRITASSYVLRPELLFRTCQTDVHRCALQYFADSSELTHEQWTVVLDDGLILEPVALEKMWLSATLRPHIAGIRVQAYNRKSLDAAKQSSDPMDVRRVQPNNNPLSPLPFLYNVTAYRNAVDSTLNLRHEAWEPFVRTVAQSRLLKEPLYTRVGAADILSFAALHSQEQRDLLPAHVYSELAFYRWSSRQDEDDMYANELLSPFTGPQRVYMSSIPHWPLESRGDKHHMMFIMPWMQMGGSEKCMLDIADKLANLGWRISFVFTMPSWQQDEHGEMSLVHEWIDRGLHITSDTFDLLALAPVDRSSRLMRYMLESRNPDFIMVANSRWAYLHSRFIRSIVPQAVMADYNHMIHIGWEGGGLPRFGANNSLFYDVHLTASKDVATNMKTWIHPQLMARDPKKVQPCHIGTDPSLFYAGAERTKVRQKLREQLNIPESTTLVLFAGRFVIDKGIDVVQEVVQRIAKDEWLANKVSFLFVGRGDQLRNLNQLPKLRPDGKPLVTIHPPADGLKQMGLYYAASDVFLLPSINEGIALVLYEAMAAGVLVITTDVGGQKEIVTDRTGILLPSLRSFWGMTNVTFDKLKEVVDEPEAYATITVAARDLVVAQYTTEKFLTCTIDNLMRVHRSKSEIPVADLPQALGLKEDIGDLKLGDDEDIKIDDADMKVDGESGGGNSTAEDDSDSMGNADDTSGDVFHEGVKDDDEDVSTSLSESSENALNGTDALIDRFKYEVAQSIAIERFHGEWNRNAAERTVESYITIGIKTYVCDNSIREQVDTLLRSIRQYHPKIMIILGNDGPHSIGDDPYIQNDDHIEEHMLPRDSGISFGRNYMVNITTTKYFVLLDDDHRFDDSTNLTVLLHGIENDDFDIVGMRIRNLPGIDELERTNIVIPRYVAIIRRFENRQLTLCVWNENKGPSVYGIQHPIAVDVLHNAFIGRVDILRKYPWRNELKVNEHMTFFLDAKDAKLRVGYLPSVFVHHRSRDYSDCYYNVRFREDHYRKLLRYKDQFLWDMECQYEFPDRVRSHILKHELDV